MADASDGGVRHAPDASAPDDGARSRSPLDAGTETTMNMTPMIDIVFQLIIFFLLSLKFKTIDERIDARLPRDRGPGPTSDRPEDLLKIKVKLIRKNKGRAESAYTLLRVDNSHTLRFPEGRWAGTAEGDALRQREYDRVRATLRGILEAKWDAMGHDPRVHAEIVAPAPDGGAVPHADAIQVLDTFLEVGLTNVVFEGARMPLAP
jgi:hypothetical protein